MRIELASHVDLSAIREVYEHARTTQREQGSVVWPEFHDAAIIGEIETQRLFRVVDADVIVGLFSVAYEDAAIWGEHERGAHLYLHRIARAAHFRGHGLMNAILDWAINQCTTLERAGLRVDTWAGNDRLIAFYQRLGFHFIGNRQIGADPRLPPHYHGNEYALLERECIGCVGP
jgi:GNAT superfamily N-acetyltransferase